MCAVFSYKWAGNGLKNIGYYVHIAEVVIQALRMDWEMVRFPE
jgi:hypothetical protein